MGAGRVFFLDPSLGAASGHHDVVAANYRRLLVGVRDVAFVGHVGGGAEHALFRHRLEDAFRVSRYGAAWVGQRPLARALRWMAPARRALPSSDTARRAGTPLGDAQYRALFDGLRAGAALDRLWAQAAPTINDDIVCIGVDPAVLAALASRRALFDAGPRLHVLFMYPEEDFVAAPVESAYWRLAREVVDIAVDVYAELAAHADALGAALGRTVAVQMTPARLTPLAPSQASDFVVAVLGAGRWDKGFDALPAIAAATHARDPAVRFHIQAPTRDAGLGAPLRDLRTMANVKLLPALLSDADYEHVLRDAGVVLLAYDKQRYRARGSGVLVDALIGGRPIIATEGTALARAAAGAASLTGVDAPSFASAIVEMRTHHPRFLAAAQSASAAYRAQLRSGPLLGALSHP